MTDISTETSIKDAYVDPEERVLDQVLVLLVRGLQALSLHGAWHGRAAALSAMR